METEDAGAVVLDFYTVMAGNEEAAEAWYAARRLPTLQDLPGVRSLRRLRKCDEPALRLTVLELESVASLADRQLERLLRDDVDGRVPVRLETLAYRQIVPNQADTPPPPAVAPYLFIVATDIRPAFESEFND